MSVIRRGQFYLVLNYAPPVTIIVILTVFMHIIYALYFRLFCGQRYRKLQRNRLVRRLFWSVVGLALILQAICAALTFELTLNAGDEIHAFLQLHWDGGSYEQMSVEQRAYWDELQTVHRCCGMWLGAADWHEPEAPRSCGSADQHWRGCVPVLVEHTRLMGRVFGWLGLATGAETCVAMAANWWLSQWVMAATEGVQV